MSAEDVKKWSGRPKPGMPSPQVPDDVRDQFIGLKGIDWTASYIDPCEWRGKDRTMITATGVAYDRIMQHASKFCAHIGVRVEEGGERKRQREAQEQYQARLQYEERGQKAKNRPFAARDAAE